MAEHELIEAYLADLAHALELPRRARRRVLAEVRDHLECAAAARRVEGLAPPAAAVRAVAAFGPADVVARRFAEELALAGTRRATGAALVAVWNYLLLLAVSTQVAPLRAASPFAHDPADAIAWLAAQVAATCVGLSALRVVRHRRDGAVPAAKLRYMNRGGAVAVGAVLVSVAADAVAAAGAGGPDRGGTARTLLLVALGAVGIVAAGALAEVVRATRRTRALARLDDRPADDVFDDLAALAPLAAGSLGPARAHPWRLCCLTGAAAGALVGAAHLAGEGPPADPALVLAVAAVFVAAEGLAVLACFALLGRFLGLRRRA
jgi:hypothetical protein